MEKIMPFLNIKLVKSKKEFDDAMNIRFHVFTLGQKVKKPVEFDGLEDEANHFVAYFGKKPVGTIRTRYPKKGVAKIERLAVLKAYRKQGIGKKIMLHVHKYLKRKGIKTLKMHSQRHAIGFYKALGYKTYGKPFVEARIPHVKMKMRLA